MKQILAVLCCIALGACGGVTVTQTGDIPAPPLEPAAAPASAQGLLSALNTARAGQGLPPLAASAAADRAALAHATDLAATGRFAHEGSDGSSVGDRMRAAGIDWCHVAENIARGQTSPGTVVADWMDSPGHRRNILSEATLAGTAIAGGIWVATFARPC